MHSIVAVSILRKIFEVQSGKVPEVKVYFGLIGVPTLYMESIASSYTLNILLSTYIFFIIYFYLF